ncbi:aldolase, partial [Aureobasidium pullulans]
TYECVKLGHAGEGTHLTQDEQESVIRAFVRSWPHWRLSAPKMLVQRPVFSNYPSHGWLRFGYHNGAPQDRYRVVSETSKLPLILFQYPDNTKAIYSLQTMLDISAQPGVIAMKNGVRNMRRWHVEIPIIHKQRPELQILTCHDEYLLHTAFDIDGFLVGCGNIAPELLIQMIEAGKAKDYARARQLHDQLLPLTKAVYHRGSHMEGTVALKHALVARGILNHATVRSPLMPLAEGADKEIHAAVQFADLPKINASKLQSNGSNGTSGSTNGFH